MPKINVSIVGMHCRSCEILIEDEYKKIPGVKSVNINHKTGKAEIFYDNTTPSVAAITEATKNAGYTIGENKKLPFFSTDKNDYTNLLKAGLIVVALYLLARATGIFNFNVNTENTGLAVVLLVGLVAGFSTCMALVGGLVLALSAGHNQKHPEATRVERFFPHLFFNLGRIIGFTILGGIIGALGSALTPSSWLFGLLTVAIGFVMIILGLKLTEIFPTLKNWSLTLPKSIAHIFGIKKENGYTPTQAIISGAATFFLPCGFTQAMQLYAVGTGSFFQGAAVMFFFALGTAPGLLGIGGLSSWFKGKQARLFFAVAGIVVIAMGIFNISNGGKLINFGDNNNIVGETKTNGIQEVYMTQNSAGYSPNVFTVQKGKTVKWIINSTAPFSCASYISMPKFNISQPLKKGENIITFTPTETGTIPFSCSMGMYRGKFIVVDDASSAPVTAIDTDNNQNGAVCGLNGCGAKQ